MAETETISIKEHFEAVLVQRDKLLDERFESQKEAVIVARRAREAAIDEAFGSLRKRLEGFPQLYATKLELEALRNVVQRLERDTVSQELYDERHDALQKELDVMRGTRGEGVSAFAGVLYKSVYLLIAAIALIVSVYVATH